MRRLPHLLTTALVLRARWVMLCLLLAFGVAIASPLVKPQSMELLCTGSGVMKLLVTAEDGAQPAPDHGQNCALCMQASAPPPEQQRLLPVAHILAHALQAIPAARVAGLTAPPLPARGPPLS